MIKVDDALANVTLLGLDTSPFIYFIERHAAYLDLMREVFRRVETGAPRACSSVVTLTEVLTQSFQQSNHALAASYRERLLNGRNFTLHPMDSAVAERAAELRARYRLSTPDALQIADALEAGCEAFLCNDAGLRRVTELRVLVLDELEL